MTVKFCGMIRKLSDSPHNKKYINEARFENHFRYEPQHPP